MNRNDRLRQLEAAQLAPTSPAPPLNVVDFATNPEYLGLKLFPRQATLLKLLCLALDQLTPYDREVIHSWASGYHDTEHPDGRRWSGDFGVVPDVLDRAEDCVRAGRWTWSEIVLVMGRRSSKSFMASIVLAWQVWRLLQLGDPQRHFGLPPAKRIVVLPYSATRETATRDFLGDVIERFRDSPCFKPYLGKVTDSSVALYTPAQLERGDKRARRRGLIEITAQATRSSTARGPAAFGLAIDEAAHLDGAGSTSTTQEILNAAKPALAQFDGYAATILASSPWTMTGGFFESMRNACAIDPLTGKSAHPTRFAIQLPSWSLYEDYERAHELQMWPGGPHFEPIEKPHIADNAALRELQRDNPDHFDVEYLSHFSSGMGRYFRELTVGKLFGDWNPPPASARASGYVIHCDPSTSGANFAVAVGHLVEIGSDHHVWIDYLFVWRPEDWPDHRVHYDVVLKKLLELVEQYRPSALYFDNHNVTFFLDQLAPAIRERHLPTIVTKVSHTQIEKLEQFEHAKTLIDHGLVHAAPHPLAVQEARFIQINGSRIGHPTSGPCQTDDLIDSIVWMVHHLKGPNSGVVAQLQAVHRAHPSAWEPSPYSEQFSALHRPAIQRPSNPARGRWNR